MKLINIFEEELIWTDIDVSTTNDVFNIIYKKAYDLGFVNENFLSKIKEREQNYPTGIQLEEYGIAIPHTDADTIKQQFIAVIIPSDEVTFKRMDDPNQSVDARLIFVLGLNTPDNQLKILQELMKMIQDTELVNNLVHALDNEEVLDLLEHLNE